MTRLVVYACLVLTMSMTSGTAMADSIKGRLGITGKIGFVNPVDNTAGSISNRTDVGPVGGVSLLYGCDDHFATEIELTRASFGSDSGEFDVTTISFGGQYRFAPQRRVVPYIGVGLEIIAADLDDNGGGGCDVDPTVGVHVSGGVDLFLRRNLALTLEAKAVAAPDARITDCLSGGRAGDFNPTSFSTTFGIRYFFS